MIGARRPASSAPRTRVIASRPPAEATRATAKGPSSGAGSIATQQYLHLSRSDFPAAYDETGLDAVRDERFLVPGRHDPDPFVVDALPVEEAFEQRGVRAGGDLVDVREERRVDDLEPVAVAVAQDPRAAVEDVPDRDDVLD